MHEICVPQPETNDFLTSGAEKNNNQIHQSFFCWLRSIIYYQWKGSSDPKPLVSISKLKCVYVLILAAFISHILFHLTLGTHLDYISIFKPKH